MELIERIPILTEPNCTDIRDLELSEFTWAQALFQPKWNEYAFPNEQQKINIMLVAGRLTLIKRALYPIINIQFDIHCWLRMKKYNSEVGGARYSMHLEGGAVDFSIKGAKCYVIRERLKSELQRLDIRMEQLPESAEWIHIDIKKPETGVRYFKP